MSNLSLTLQASPVLFGIIVLVIILLSYFIYRVTVPPIPGALKSLLVFLRTAGLVAVLMIFFEPVLTVVTRTETPPRVALIIDNSKSMQLIDGAGDRSEVVRELLNHNMFQRLARQDKLSAILFAGEASHLPSFHPDSVRLDGPATNIDAALKKLREIRDQENIKMGILISDGNYNVGPRPVYEAELLTIPLHTFGVGDSLQQRDLLISRVIANEIAYLGAETPIDVRVRSYGFGGERVAVSITDGDGNRIEEKTITLAEGTADYELSFLLTPQQEGMQRYTVSVEELPDEITHENNHQSFFVRVIDRRMNVLLLSGTPSEDLVFLRRLLEHEDAIDVTLSVQLSGGTFLGESPTEARIREADLLILVGFPTRDSSPSLIDAILSILGEQEKPLLFIESSSVDARRIDSILPVVVDRTQLNESQTFAHLSEAHSSHPIVRFGTGAQNADWFALPPVFRTSNRYVVRPGSEVIMTHRSGHRITDDPFLVLRSVDGRRSAALLGYGLWRWRMMGRGNVDGEMVYDNFMYNLVEWLTTDETQDQVRITASKEQYHTGESIEFLAQVYDEQFRPLNGAEVRVLVTSAEQVYETVLTARGHGRYEGRISPLPEGEYEYVGVAEINGNEIGRDDGLFTVGELNLEFLDTRMNIQLMRQLAEMTGGRYMHQTEIHKVEELLNELYNYEARIDTASRDYQIWNLPAALGVFIFFFSLEWFLRKRNGML